MKAEYILQVVSGVKIPVPANTSSIEIDSGVCSWRAGEDGHLMEVILEFRGLPLTFSDDQRILPCTPLLQERAFRIGKHVANQIFLQTGLEAIDPKQVVLGSPNVFPEGAEEIEAFWRTPRRVWKSIEVNSSVRGVFDPGEYEKRATHSVAYGYFADALRTTGVFQRFELLYKIIEYFFHQEGSSLDQAVSNHLVQVNPAYNSKFIKDLRKVRNRIVHPRAREGALRVESLVDDIEVRNSEPKLRALVTTLLSNPPF